MRGYTAGQFVKLRQRLDPPSLNGLVSEPIRLPARDEVLSLGTYSICSFDFD